MAFSARILADSHHPVVPSRLVTMELTYPRCIHAEFMTHRMFSRNSASSRAIPVEKMLSAVMREPFIPISWGTNQKGMVAAGEHADPDLCRATWFEGMNRAVDTARRLMDLGLHKQIVNRVLEPYMWITVIATGVDHAWENFFKLRCAPDAEPHIQKIAYMARHQFDGQPGTVERHPAAVPRVLQYGEYHLPLFGFPGDENLAPDDQPRVSVARCARVAYLTHDGKRDVAADLTLFNRLKDGGHWSPFEHVAEPDGARLQGGGNFGPHWKQYRKQFAAEYCRQAPRDPVIDGYMMQTVVAMHRDRSIAQQ